MQISLVQQNVQKESKFIGIGDEWVSEWFLIKILINGKCCLVAKCNYFKLVLTLHFSINFSFAVITNCLCYVLILTTEHSLHWHNSWRAESRNGFVLPRCCGCDRKRVCIHVFCHIYKIIFIIIYNKKKSIQKKHQLFFPIQTKICI